MKKATEIKKAPVQKAKAAPRKPRVAKLEKLNFDLMSLMAQSAFLEDLVKRLSKEIAGIAKEMRVVERAIKTEEKLKK